MYTNGTQYITEIFQMKSIKLRTVHFKLREELVKDLEEIIRLDGHYRNKTEILNSMIRDFVRSYWKENNEFLLNKNQNKNPRVRRK